MDLALYVETTVDDINCRSVWPSIMDKCTFKWLCAVSGWYILQIGRTARLVNKVYIILLQMNAVYLLSAFVSACDTLPFRSAVGRYCARLLSVCLSVPFSFGSFFCWMLLDFCLLIYCLCGDHLCTLKKWFSFIMLQIDGGCSLSDRFIP